MRPRPLARALLGLGAAGAIAPWTGVAAETSNLAETTPLVWVLIGISVTGALITYAFLAYALWRYRDPHTKGRRYG
ncbi:MAG: hypothetical protein L3J81_01825 [Thermoplasmata archaeon]|nr:hypothetical protein [Thermoplasmata archaeon]